MLTGKRAFRASTAADTMSAILKEEPPEMSEANRQIPSALERIVRHCLEKNSEERFQSARDVAFDLEALSSVSGTASTAVQPKGAPRLSFVAKTAFGLIGLLLVATGGLYFGRRNRAKPPVCRRLTFRQGSIQAARFMPDGQSVIYSASFEGNPADIFTTRPQGPESRSMGLTGTTLLAVSPQGEAAILLQSHSVQIAIREGTLARVPLEGGVPREILAHIESADWSPDGSSLLITRQVEGGDRLEAPPGKLIFQNAGAIGHPRFSPQGDRIAFFDHPARLGDAGSVAVVDLAGHVTLLSNGWTDLTGLAWSPDGKEVWFTGTRESSTAKLFAVTLDGVEREQYRNVGDLLLFDVARDGRMLLAQEDWRSGIYGLGPGDTHERDLSWFDYSVAVGLSGDGRTMLFTENGESVGSQEGTSYLRGTDGSPALRISEGLCWALSPDSQTVICTNSSNQLTQVPAKTGEVKRLTNDELVHGISAWFPDQKKILFLGLQSGHNARLYSLDIAEGKSRATTPEGASSYFRVSPDGEQIAVAMGSEYRTTLYSASGGEGRPVRAAEPGEVPVAWSADGRALFCQKLGQMPFDIIQIDLNSGKRTLWKQIMPPNPLGVTFTGQAHLSSDLKSYVYTVDRRLDVLYVVDGLH